METADIRCEDILVHRMRKARIRQWMIAFTSVLAAAGGVAFLSPAAIGSFSYYTLSALLLLNATFALRQSVLVLFPIETLLRQLRRIERDIDAGRLDTGHISIHSDDAFACLTAGIENLVSKLIEKARVSSEKAKLANSMLEAIPFTLFTASRSGKVFCTIKDEYKLFTELAIEPGKRPPEEVWGETNAAKFVKCVATSFSNDGFQWFDADIGAHHLRGCVKRINELTALVAIGDLPAIDKRVTDAAGASSACDFTHRQESLRRFAATLAHDGRNVFNVLGNLIEVNKASTDPSVRERVPIAEDAISRGKKLMDELMQYAGETHYRLLTVSAAEAFESVLNSPTLKAMIPENITLVSELAKAPMEDIDIDPDQVWKVTFNLVKNSVEAIGQAAGRIWLKEMPFAMTPEEAQSFQFAKKAPSGTGVLFTEADDGPGVSPQIIGRMFEPFVSSKGEGRGLGLSKALSIIEAHGGAVRVRSRRGHGTSFEIFIPASRRTQAALEKARESAPNGEVLLVDDDPMILRTTQLVLNTHGIASHQAASESEALDHVRTLGPRLNAVLSDANLNGTTSANLIRKIREINPDLRIILTSGSNESSVRDAFAETPYDGFLTKPYTAEELKKTLAKGGK